MRPSIRQLEYFVALSETLNFREAAESCHVTQPALSMQIRELERELGVTLFERDRRKVFLTQAGKEAVEKARRVLENIDQLVEKAASVQKPLSATLRLGVIPTVAPYLLPRFVSPLHRDYPDLKLLIREEKTDRIMKQLQVGELDLVIVALESELGDVETRPIFEDPFMVAVPSEHPFVNKSVIAPEELEGEPLLLLEDGHCLRDQTRPICDSAGACELAEFKASSLLTLIQMVETGVALTLLPKLATEVETQHLDNVTLVPFTEPVPSRTVGVAWRKSSPRENEYELLVEIIKQSISEVVAP